MDTATDKTAILIPCYNAAPHLKQCLESAIDQNCWIIFCDDCSTDDSLAIAKNYPTIEILTNKFNLGVGLTRQKLVNKAKLKAFDFVQFLDADDFLLPNKIKNQLTELLKWDVVIDPLLEIFPDGQNAKTIYFSKDLSQAARIARIWHLNTCLFNLSRIPTFRPTRCCNDALFMVDCLKTGLKAFVRNNIPATSVYRRNWGEGQITTNYHREREQLSIAFRREIEEIISDAKDR